MTLRSRPPHSQVGADSHGSTLTDIPQRYSLSAQVADILRRKLRRGEWKSFLPGEIPLCDHLQVSRPTLRTALEMLAREGLLHTVPGHPRRITSNARKLASRQPSQVVGFLSSVPFHEMTSYTIFSVGELRRHLQDAGYKLEVYTDRRYNRGSPFKELERLVIDVQASCWILHRMDAAVQHWFDEQGLRALVRGSTHPGIRFPFIDGHHRAACRHAVGVFTRLGHRRIAGLFARSDLAGDLDAQNGFLEAFQRSSPPGTTPLLVMHDSTVRSLKASLTNLFRSRQPPTAILVHGAKQMLTVISHLMHAMIRIPQDVSLICMDDDFYLQQITPAVACYCYNRDAYNRRFNRMVLRLASNRIPTRQFIRVIPQLRKGETLGPAPDKPATVRG